MTAFDSIIEILKLEGHKPEIESHAVKNHSWKQLKWIDGNDECTIYEGDVSVFQDEIAWFQTSRKDNHLLRIVTPGSKFEWVPKTYNPIFGCYCLLIEWYKHHLVFIYQEKHGIYVSSLKGTTVKYFYIHGEELEGKGGLLAYETYQNKMTGYVRLIELPLLNELEPITKEEAELRGLIPQDLNRPDGFLNHSI